MKFLDGIKDAIDEAHEREAEEEVLDEEEEDEEEEDDDNRLAIALTIGGTAVGAAVVYGLCKHFGVFTGIKNHFEGKLNSTLLEEGKEIVDAKEMEEFRKWKEAQDKEEKKEEKKDETTKK